MRTKKFCLTGLAVLCGLMAACSTSRTPAPIVDSTQGVQAAQPVKPGAGSRAPGRSPFYTVKKGDTLYRIALEQGQSYRDLIAWNSLANPNDIKVDQVLRVLPPDAAPGSAPVQTASVVSAEGVEVRTLSAVPPSSGGNVPNKTLPRGDKRPYSEAALAELQKPEAVESSSSTAVKPGNSKPIEPIPVEKAAGSEAAAEEDRVAWIWPTDGKIVGSFDENKKGIDIAGKSGQQVVAAGAGKVMYAGSGIRGYGNLIILKHSNSLLSAYAHNKTILVKEGQVVSKGQQIAEMGSSDADAVELHFEIRQQGKPVDPSKFLPIR